MKFMFVTNGPDRIISFRGDILKAVRDTGAEVHVAAPGLSACEKTAGWLRDHGIRVHDIYMAATGTNPFQDLRALVSIRAVIQRVAPDCVMGHTIKPVIYGSLAARLCGVPRIFALITGLGYAFTEGENPGPARRFLSWLSRTLYRFALRHAQVVFFQNPDDDALFRRAGLASGGTRTVVVNGSGVNLDRFPRAPLPQGIRFLFVGRLLVSKGVRLYAEAAERVRRTHPQATFAVAGWFDENPDAIGRDELDRWIREGTIDYVGHVSDIRPELAASSVFVLPSTYREGTPRSALEALATGRAVITTDSPGCRETVREGENGFLIQPGSLDDLVAGMTRLIEEPALVERMGEASRRIAEHRYDVNRVNAVMLEEMGLGRA